jgi:MOSC domain-containing protein YiiM
MQANNLGKVLQLFTTVKGDPSRIAQSELILDTLGVIGDKFHGKGLDRSVLIAAVESYNIAKENDINIDDGLLGENILISYNLYHLLPGDKFAIGEVSFEITQNCTLCKGLSSVNSKLPKLLKNDRGIFAKVLHSGRIKIGDNIKLLNN